MLTFLGLLLRKARMMHCVSLKSPVKETCMQYDSILSKAHVHGFLHPHSLASLFFLKTVRGVSHRS